MATSVTTPNYDKVTQGMRILQAALGPFVHRALSSVFGGKWYTEGVLLVLSDAQRNNLPATGVNKEMADALDLAALLTVMERRWGNVFASKVPRETRTYVNELMSTRNKWAHVAKGDMSEGDAWRGLDTMTRLLELTVPAAARETEALAKELRQKAETQPEAAPTAPIPAPKEHSVPGQTTNSAAPTAVQAAMDFRLRPWREVITPHEDVAAGRYQQAEFAADLAQVLSGKAEAEYQDPVEFFSRTYLTEGMSQLLTSSVERLSGKGGDPVFQLKTAFGGGKTHTMLALYHLLRGRGKLDKLAGVKGILEAAGVGQLPKARIAVFVGTAMDPTRPHLDAGGNGIEVRTLWGEVAAQLGGKEGYEIVRVADKQSVSPMADSLVELFDRFGPAVVLIDELVAYARNIYGNANLCSGTFDSLMSFVQSLTDAAKRAKRSMLVASLPESDMEVGGPAGQEALASIEHIFGRSEVVWKPVSAREGFEIVRRRLFDVVKDDPAKEQACLAFSRLYSGGSADFPRQCGESDYLERLRAAYPIHPELFDRLYEDWATLERFQRTRGVLRLMAATIHALWMRDDRSLLIQPGSVPLDNTRVKHELQRYLPEGWSAVMDRDVDGEGAEPRRIDQENPRLGVLVAAERVARTIFLGSAPHVSQQRVRGIEDVRVRLGVAQPGESIAVFNDALGKLADRLTYLYTDKHRYWYDTHPNLRRTAEDRASRLEEYEILKEIEGRLRKDRDRASFRGVHWCPDRTGADVPDEQAARLVVLKPEYRHSRNRTDSEAMLVAMQILEYRGNSPRQHRNTLVFVAADSDGMEGLDQEVRRFLAWTSVVKDSDVLNLDAHQRKQAADAEKRSDETVRLRLQEAYSWMLVPAQDPAGPWQWETSLIQGGDTSCVVRAANKLQGSDQLVTKWSPAVLRMELDKWLWRDASEIGLKKLWEYLCTYGYLSRLSDQEVLLEAVAQGLRSRDFFGYADGVSDGRYQGLVFGQATLSTALHIDELSVLVKPEAAVEQQRVDEETERRRRAPDVEQEANGAIREARTEDAVDSAPVAPSKPRLKTRYHGTAGIDPIRVAKDAGQIAEEVIQHLTSLNGAKVKVTLEIEADVRDGVPDNVVNIVLANGSTLKFENQGFEEE
jgi:predicted AAA+ superfamily ATPase